MIAVIFERFGPYHDARLTAAHTHVSGGVVAIEMFAKDVTYEWDVLPGKASYPRVTVISDATPDSVAPRRIWRAMHKVLDELAPDCVAIPGWSHPAAIAALHWARTHRVPSVLMSESTEADRRRSGFSEAIKSVIVSLYDAALVGGEKHKAYAIRLGMPEDKIFVGYDVVDNEYFSAATAKLRASTATIRSRLALPEWYFLCSARFVPVKNLLMLLDAFRDYQRMVRENPWDLVILGDGPERASIEQRVDALGLRGCVHLAGFRQYDELPGFYALAEAFILPSISEPWGLVVNEAMASGLPVLVSSCCGCVPELVSHMETGLVFDPLEPEELCEVMRKISTDKVLRRRLAAAAIGRVNNWGPAKFTEGLQDAAEAATGGARAKRRWLTPILPLFARVIG